jgi:alkanesulfonate monooxygenase SsuD/methylene tetrahydromethanopterin reductase-like flavin-dependent oxidoreductase (luciferase family)
MDVAIGLPNAVPETKGDDLVEFARRAEDAGFSSLGTIDRLVFPNYDPLIALSAAAAGTDRIRLATTVLITVYRENARVLAKQAASVQALSDGRLVLVVGIGAREDDYEAAGVSTAGRGRRHEEMLDEMKRVWSGAEYGYAGGIGPDVSSNPPELVIGGAADVVFPRAAKYGAGWMMGGGTPEQFDERRQKLEAAWRAAGREGEPRKMGLVYYSLGPDGEANAKRSVGAYYAWLGEFGEQIVAATAKDEDTVRRYRDGFEQVGCEELFFFPGSSDPEQVDLLAAAAL